MKKNITAFTLAVTLIAYGLAPSLLAQPAPEPANNSDSINLLALATADEAKQAAEERHAAEKDRENAAEATQETTQAIHEALDTAHKALKEFNLGDFAVNFGGAFRLPTTQNRALVIPKDEIDAKTLSDTEEDLTVMARILEKTTNKDHRPHAMGIYVHTPFTYAEAPANLYLDGYGAVFFLNVSFPLLPPPPKEDVEAKNEPPSEWDEARREVLHPNESNPNPPTWVSPAPPSPPGSTEEYNPAKIDDLKKDLLNALRNATHLRAVKPDEFVTIVVTAPDSTGQKTRTVHAASVGGGGGGAFGGQSSSSTPGAKPIPRRQLHAAGRYPATGERPSKLTIRARKSDIDAFEKDHLSFDDFRKKVSMLIF